ncbi:MAG: hypothetical protein IPH07_24170 [Deltaproteobacteria bacterium]|nr:hypothetical protein [Deltaproteobacteria bacterium]
MINDHNDNDQHGADALTAGRYPTNDSGNASRLMKLFGGDFRYAEGLGWLRWNGQRWTIGDGPHHEAELCATLIVEDGKRMGGEVGEALVKWGRTSGNAGRIAAAVEVLRHRPEVRIDADQLDADPWLFCCRNGTIDLRTGTLREHRREDMITRQSPVEYDAAATCPRFLQFLGECHPGAPDVVWYLLRWLGYSLTGSVREHVFGLWYGAGRNGKSTLLELALHVWGDYGCAIQPDLLLERGSDQHPTGLMDLRGARLVVTSEPPAGRRWNESLVKQLTGGDSVTARRMRQDPVTFRPSHTMTMACNARPIVRDQGAAFWSRVHPLEWGVSFRGREDRELDTKLRMEAPGVLALAVQGCLAWQTQGLNPPAAVAAARDDYHASQDVIGVFVAEQLTPDPLSFLPRNLLYGAFSAWAQRGGEYCPPASVLYRQLEERGWQTTKREGSRGFMGWRWADQPVLSVARSGPG